MRFSATLPYPSGEADWAEYDELVELARAAERLGLDAVSATDHPFPVVASGYAGHHALDPFVLLSVIGGATSSVRLHFSLVVAAYRNPFALARQISSLDILSRGRCIVALGAGYLRSEFAALGASYDRRGPAVDETLREMDMAWTGDPVVASGPGWTAEGNVMRPRPYSAPRPSIWRGGNSTTALRSAVAHFDGWSPFEIGADFSSGVATSSMSFETLPARLAQADRMVAESGRTTPLETCFVRTSTKWLSDRTRAADELCTMADAGLDWLEFKVYGRNHRARLDSLEEFAELARSCGLRDCSA